MFKLENYSNLKTVQFKNCLDSKNIWIWKFLKPEKCSNLKKVQIKKPNLKIVHTLKVQNYLDLKKV
jgi:hypothetical protein